MIVKETLMETELDGLKDHRLDFLWVIQLEHLKEWNLDCL